MKEDIIPARIHFWLGLSKKAKQVEIVMTDEERESFAKSINDPNFKGLGRTIVPKKDIMKLSPNKIDNKRFWKTLDDGYKLLAVSGNQVKDEYNANILNMRSAEIQGATKIVSDKINKSLWGDGDSLKILEIGFGFGAFADWSHQKIGGMRNNIEYYGIDINKRIDKYQNLYETDGWKIPKEIPRYLDIVYSMNVFQHLSQKQRFNYFKKAYKRLKNDGIMIFSSFIMTEENKNDPCWGLIDENGTGYCHFFNQPTEVDRDTELKEMLEKVGFEIDKFEIKATNHLFCVAIKRVRVITEGDPYGEENWDDDIVEEKKYLGSAEMGEVNKKRKILPFQPFEGDYKEDEIIIKYEY